VNNLFIFILGNPCYQKKDQVGLLHLNLFRLKFLYLKFYSDASFNNIFVLQFLLFCGEEEFSGF